MLLVMGREGESKALVVQMLSYTGEGCVMSFNYGRYTFTTREGRATCVIQ